MKQDFQHSNAFCRNVGWVSEGELERFRGKRIAIAGLGGVGGSHLLTLVRLGIGNFAIADMDRFEFVNFNRQVGATLTHLNRPKTDVLAEMALDINPDLDLRRFSHGIDEGNIDAFLSGVDIYVDGLDFFVMDVRRALFAACAKKGIPAVTAAPLGWGVSLLVFDPDGMSFEEYFQMDGQSEQEMLRRFLVGLSPQGLQLRALVDPSRLDIENHRGPSTAVGCNLCAALAAGVAVKMLLGRGDVRVAPESVHFDAFLNEFQLLDRPGGMSHPEMQARLRAARDQAAKKV